MLPVPSRLQPSTEPGLVRRFASGWVRLGLLGWLSRLGVALVFVLGMLATASATRVESESEISVEGSEDCETVETVNNHAVTARRPSGAVGASARKIDNPGAPRALVPRRPAPPRPSWLRPRRTVPPDDDDDDSLA